MAKDGAVPKQPGRRTKEPSNGTITLYCAFRWVLACIEETSGTPADLRRGLKPGDLIAECEAMPIFAVGPSYKARFTSLQAPARKGHEPRRPPRPAVPIVPDDYQLRALLEDYGADREVTSAAERHVCEAHLWLTNQLSGGLLAGWADHYIRRSEVADVAIDHAQVDPNFWAACNPSYADASACSMDDDWEGDADGYRFRGNLVARDVVIDMAGLRTNLVGIASVEAGTAPGVQAVLKPEGDGASGRWVIGWKGVECTVDTLGSQLRSRGMRAIAILIRHEGSPISHYLLDGLDRKPSHGRLTDIKEKERLDKIRKAIDPISQALFNQCVDLKEAHQRLERELVRLKCEDDNIGQSATWGLEFTGVEGRVSPDGRRVGDNVRKSVGAAIKLIGDGQAENCAKVAEFLEGNVRSDKFSYKYNSKGAPVAWTVITSTAQQLALEADTPISDQNVYG